MRLLTKRFIVGGLTFSLVAVLVLLLTSCAFTQVPANPKKVEELYHAAAEAKTVFEQALLVAYSEYQVGLLTFDQFGQAKMIYQQFAVAQAATLAVLKIQYPTAMDWDALQPKGADALLQVVLHRDLSSNVAP